MKYGESAFDVLYLITAICLGILMLKKARTKAERRMGRAALVLGCGDAFHLVPRVLNYFVAADFSAALGIGKLITSLTMTVFYIYLYYIWVDYYREKNNKNTLYTLYALSILRFALCLFPQNEWLQNGNNMLWGVIRNIPFVCIGVILAVLYFKNRKETRRFRFLWLYIVLSFAFYIPVVLFSGSIPLFGMLMLPKTICYVLMLLAFYCAVTKDEAR